MAEIVMGLGIAALLIAIIIMLYRQTSTEEEIQRELERHVIEHLKHNPCQPRRDSKGRFTSSEPEDDL